MKTIVSGNVALVQGPSYDLSSVLVAHEMVIDALTDAFGPAALAVDLKRNRRRVAWPDPGKIIAREAWGKLKELHDAAPIALTFIFKEMTVKARLLGTLWCVQDVKSGDVTLHDGKPVSEIDPLPMLHLFGPLHNEGKEFEFLSGSQADRIAAVMTGPLANVGFGFQRSTVTNAKTAQTGKTDAARIAFPHNVFGNGRAWLSVHCQSSDGGQPDSNQAEN